MILAVATTLVLHFTNPSYNADSTGCGSSFPLTDLKEVRVYGQEGVPWSPNLLLAVKPEGGREGMADSVAVDIPNDNMWVLGFVAIDSTGNQSCAVDYVVNPVLGVQPEAESAKRDEWYDVAGRRVPAPTRTGIYYRHRGRSTKRVVHVQ